MVAGCKNQKVERKLFLGIFETGISFRRTATWRSIIVLGMELDIMGFRHQLRAWLRCFLIEDNSNG